jgi:anti-anti-sigma factor
VSVTDIPTTRIEVRPLGTTTEIGVIGELDIASAGELARAIQDALGRGPETLLVDLCDVSFLDSSALHVLIKTHHCARSAGAALVVLRPSGPADRAFTVGGMSEMFPLRPAAVDRFLTDWSR